MTEIQPNIPLLRKAVEWAEAEAAKPETECRWDQGNWVASPRERAYTIATERTRNIDSHDERVEARDALVRELEPQCGTCYCIAGYVATQVLGASYELDSETENIAAEAMGLYPWQANDLFEADNTIADVRRIAEDIAGERL